MSDPQIIIMVIAAFFVGAAHGFHIGWLKYGRRIFIGKREAR